MGPERRLAVLLFAALALLACKPPPSAVAPAAGIAWREGDVEAALGEARERDQPVLLYWGAKWCPPCNQLQATVFQRAAFIEQTRQFVAVHLDGDSPGAQRWAEYFGVIGYPTLIILRPDRSELTRLSGGTDIEEVPRLLALALRQGQPVSQLAARAGQQPQTLSADDWQLLAAYGWDVDAQKLLPAREPEQLLEKLAAQCPQAAARRRLALQALALRGRQAQAALPAAARVPAQHLLRGVLTDPLAVNRELSLLEFSGADMVGLFQREDPAAYRQLSDLLITAMDRVFADASLSVGDRINSAQAELQLWRQQHRRQAVPKALADKIRARAHWADLQARTPYERQNAIDAAAALLLRAGLHAQARALLIAELPRSLAPYYHMASLAELAEQDGQPQAAVDWLRKAYAGAQGPATRAQWGVRYVEGLLRLRPQDTASIVTAMDQLLRELAVPEGAYYQRTRRRFERLGLELQDWGRMQHQQAQLQRWQAQMQPLCAQLPADSDNRRSCEQFLPAV